MVPISGEFVVIPKITFDLGIKVQQSRITVDRAKNFKFALALKNCVNGKTAAASRRVDGTQTVLTEIPAARPDGADVNGSVLRAFAKGFFPFEEMTGLMPMPDPRINTGK
jgi:hypothetical protein